MSLREKVDDNRRKMRDIDIKLKNSQINAFSEVTKMNASVEDVAEAKTYETMQLGGLIASMGLLGYLMMRS